MAAFSPRFIHRLQLSNATGRNGSLPSLYRNHIENSGRLILQGAEGLQGRALLLGLGNAMEYGMDALSVISGQFDEITVVDADAKALDQTVQSQQANAADKFRVIIDDLGEGVDIMMVQADAIIDRARTPAQAEKAFVELLNSGFSRRGIAELNAGGYDYVVIVGY